MLKFIISAIILFSGCAPNVPDSIVEKQPAPESISKVKLHKLPNGYFSIPTLYWATPSGVAESNWDAVFGGTVIEVKNASEILGGDFNRKFVSGAIKVEKIFLNLPDTSEITINSIIRSEDFDGLKKDDKVIIFITGEYEGSYVRNEIEGTNSKLGFKVENWNEPLVSAVEKAAACDKTEIRWIEGFPKDFRAKTYNCYKERRNLILDDPQISEIWKQNDPQGFQHLIEYRQYENSPENN